MTSVNRSVLLVTLAALVAIAATLVVINRADNDRIVSDHMQSVDGQMPWMMGTTYGELPEPSWMRDHWNEMGSWMSDHPEWMQRHWGDMGNWLAAHPEWMRRHWAGMGQWMKAHPGWMNTHWGEMGPWRDGDLGR